MAWVEVLPKFAMLFRARRWESAASFLDWTGILVNQHRTRQVEQVCEPEALARTNVALTSASGSRFYLKKEFAVRWHDRFRNAWHGFGWCATAVREAATLRAVRDAGIGCPEVAAFGEDSRRAFVLTCDESAMTELRMMLPTLSDVDRNRLADSLGRELAKMHDAGFDHPDLFAKHILAAPDGDTYRLCILDWQRSRRRKAVSWRLRCHDLAVLDATLHESLASDRLRLRFLRSYLHATGQAAPPLGRLANQIRREATTLHIQRNIRTVGQRATPAKDQQFVLCDGGRLLVVRSFHESTGGCLPEWMMHLDDSAAASFAIDSGSDIVRLRASTPARNLPPLVHTLFRLQLFGVATTRLRAVGFLPSQTVLVVENPAGVPFVEAYAKADSITQARLLPLAGQMIRQLHEAGYQLTDGDSWERRLGITAAGTIVLTRPETLTRCNASWQDLAPTELNRQYSRLSRTEQLRFMQGYLQQRGHKAERSPAPDVSERQVTT